MRPKVLLINPMPPVFFDLLEDVDIEAIEEKLTPPQLTTLLVTTLHDALCCGLANPITAEILNAAGAQLRVVANYAVGYSNVDVAAASARRIAVTNTPDVLTDATADCAMGLLLAVSRRLVEGDRLARSGERWEWRWDFMRGGDFKDAVLGIVGFGRIGQALARRALGFGMKVIYPARGTVVAEDLRGCVEAKSFEDVVCQSDYISINCPLNAATHHLFNEAVIASMKSTAILINTARGPIVDEDALVAALQARRIGGAGLDVFENEPDLAPGLAELGNVVLTPHIGSATVGTRDAMATVVARNVLAALRGEVPPNCVNPAEFGWLEKPLL
jgi:glyoxylate reductase